MFNDPTTLAALGLMALVAIVFAVLWLRARKSGQLADPLTLLTQANTLARDIVAAGDQLWRTGKLPREQRYDWAAKELNRVLPRLDPEQVRIAVEAGVYWLKAGAAALGVALPDGPANPQQPTRHT